MCVIFLTSCPAGTPMGARGFTSLHEKIFSYYFFGLFFRLSLFFSTFLHGFGVFFLHGLSISMHMVPVSCQVAAVAGRGGERRDGWWAYRVFTARRGRRCPHAHPTIVRTPPTRWAPGVVRRCSPRV